MSRRIWLSLLAILVAFCLGLSLIAFGGAAVIIANNGAAPLELTPTPQSSVMQNATGIFTNHHGLWRFA